MMDSHPSMEVRILNPFSRSASRASRFVTRRCLILVAIATSFAVLYLNDQILAQENNQSYASEKTEQQPSSPDDQEPIRGYPVRERRIGTPTDIEWDLDNSFPESDSLLELILRCDENKNDAERHHHHRPD